jgi:broad specificity phosphatase PhoE
VTDLLLLRHGEATHNLSDQLEGWGATPLTEEGQQQAEALALRLVSWSLPIAGLYTSPLLRAWQTTASIARRLKVTPIAHDGLREINFGQVNGLTLESFRTTMPQVYARWQDRSDMTFQFPGGEQRLAFFRRVGLALDEILARHRGECVAIVAHGGTLRGGLAYLLPETMSDQWTYAVHNASLTHVHVGQEGNVLVALNDCQHLHQA